MRGPDKAANGWSGESFGSARTRSVPATGTRNGSFQGSVFPSDSHATPPESSARKVMLEGLFEVPTP